MSTVLVVAAHPDDEVLGCGGSLVRHTSQGDTVHVVFMTTGVYLPDAPLEEVEAAVVRRQVEARAAAQALGLAGVEFLTVAPTLGVTAGPQVVAAIERVIANIGPRVIYCHRQVDENPDHRAVAEAALIAARFWTGRSPRDLEEIRGFPIPPVRYTDDLRMVAALRMEDIEKKLAALACYQSELERISLLHPRQPDLVRAQAEVWGSWIGAPWAEAFELLWRRAL